MIGFRSSTNLVIWRFATWIGAAALCLVSAEVSAQSMRQPPVYQYQQTAPDVDPGVDHGNSDAGLPEEFQKQLVL
ncbi:MAG: hypothetical protein WCD52_01955, partial [Xanthobacteraceae bacterium]